MNTRKTSSLDDYNNMITQSIKLLKEFLAKNHEYEEHRAYYLSKEKERQFINYAINQLDSCVFEKKRPMLDNAQKQINFAKEAVNKTGLEKKHDLILKNNSPVFKIPNKESPKINNLVDKTPIDPYHPWSIVRYSGK